RATWLEISHWTGPVPQLTVGQDWVYGGKNREIYGQLKYLGVPVYGLHTTRYGVPTGGYGTLIYLDVLDAPAYGPGWHRENSFVPPKSSGGFCYGFYTFDPTKGGYKHPPGQTGMRGPGVGTMYRLTAHGPGAAPDVEWTGPALGPYDKTNPQDPGAATTRSLPRRFASYTRRSAASSRSPAVAHVGTSATPKLAVTRTPPGS